MLYLIGKGKGLEFYLSDGKKVFYVSIICVLWSVVPLQVQFIDDAGMI